MIKLGVLGLSPGNGHPYSWSAICNGYNKAEMDNCGFPAIPSYLSKRDFPRETIQNAEVTHVWTQDRSLSRHIALCSNITHVVSDFREMIGEIDGILLARDDSENHLYYAKPFLEAGIPIYIDKPLALTLKNAQEILKNQLYPGQIFSCSALRYAKELSLTRAQFRRLGRIKSIIGHSPKSWDKYSIHIIDPMLRLFPELRCVARISSSISNDQKVSVVGESTSGLAFKITTLGECSLPISFTIVGECDSISLEFFNTFQAFKSALEVFIGTSCQHKIALTESQMLSCIQFVEAGIALT